MQNNSNLFFFRTYSIWNQWVCLQVSNKFCEFCLILLNEYFFSYYWFVKSIFSDWLRGRVTLAYESDRDMPTDASNQDVISDNFLAQNLYNYNNYFFKFSLRFAQCFKIWWLFHWKILIKKAKVGSLGVKCWKWGIGWYTDAEKGFNKLISANGSALPPGW